MSSGAPIIVASAPSHKPKMEITTTFWVFVIFISVAFITIGFDRVFHNRERPGFALGIWISAFAVCGMFLLFSFHSQLSHKAALLTFFALLLIVFAGTLLVDQNNIDDQESGRMSRYGTWWDGWEDNYFSNIFDKWETWAAIAFVGFLMFNVAVSNDPADGAVKQASNSSTNSNKVAVKKAEVKTTQRQVHHAQPITQKMHNSKQQMHNDLKRQRKADQDH